MTVVARSSGIPRTWDVQWSLLFSAIYLEIFVAVPRALGAFLALGCARFVYGREVEVKIPASLAGLVVGCTPMISLVVCPSLPAALWTSLVTGTDLR